MAEKVLMLALSPTMEEGTIVDWKVKEGDQIEENQVLCEVETDKTTMEYESQVEGTLLKIIVESGGGVKVGETFAVVGEKGEDIADILASVESEKSAAPSAQAASPEVAAPAQAAPSPAAPAPAVSSGPVKASPLARKIAADKGINLAGIAGSGPGGRIVKRDVQNAPAGGGVSGTSAAASSAAPYVPARLEDKVIPVSDKRRIIAQRLAESKYTAPHYYLSVNIELDNLIAARNKINKKLRDKKVSMNAFFIKMAAEALKKHPQVNSSWQGDKIIQHGSADIALAVAQPDGLITPLVRSTESKGILQIDDEMTVLIQKAFDNKLSPDEYTGATFTISNLGSFGIDEFTAIINPPGAAILAIGKGQKEPVVDESGNIVVRTRMKVNLSCDHRVIDGAVGAAFLADLKAIIEDPINALV